MLLLVLLLAVMVVEVLTGAGLPTRLAPYQAVGEAVEMIAITFTDRREPEVK